MTTSDFGSVTINGRQTFLGTIFGIFFTPQEAASFIAGVINANPANGGVDAGAAEGRVILTSRSGGEILIDDLQTESDGDLLNNALIGLAKGQRATGTLTGEVVSLFDPARFDTADPNRPPILRLGF